MREGAAAGVALEWREQPARRARATMARICLICLLIALLAAAQARLLEDGATYSLQDVNGTFLVADPDAGDSTLRYEPSSPPDAVFTAVRAKRGRWYLRFGDASTGMLLTAFGNYKTAAWCDPACGAVWRIRRRRRDGRVALSSAFIGTYLHSSLDNFDVEQGTVRDAGSWWTLHKHDGPVATPTVGERLSEALESVSTSLVSSAREFTSMLSATDAPADEPAVRPRGIRLRPRRAYAAAAAVVAASTALVVPSQLVGRTIIGAERSLAVQNLWRNSELRRVLASGTLTGLASDIAAQAYEGSGTLDLGRVGRTTAVAMASDDLPFVLWARYARLGLEGVLTRAALVHPLGGAVGKAALMAAYETVSAALYLSLQALGRGDDVRAELGKLPKAIGAAVTFFSGAHFLAAVMPAWMRPLADSLSTVAFGTFLAVLSHK